MQRIRLRKASWEYDPSVTLGPSGGFGTVFLGRSEDGKEVAIKKLHISSASAGNRELVISEELEGKTLPHVIPFYDSGIDTETMDYFVAMAKAECLVVLARGMAATTLSGYLTHHSKTCIPPIEPPTTASNFSMPK